MFYVANLSFDLLKRNTIVWGAGKHSVAGRSHCKINQIDFHKNPQVFIISKPDFGINKINITKSLLLARLYILGVSEKMTIRMPQTDRSAAMTSHKSFFSRHPVDVHI